eukprot:gene8350-9923_t
MDILAHIRTLVEKQGLLADPENKSGQTTKNLHDLEMVVDDLHRENMALRKMIKSLLTPLAREGFVGDGFSVEDVEKEISVFEEYATHANKKSPQSPRSRHASPLRLGGEMEDDADDQIIENLANSVETAKLNIHSPYENFLPSISPNARDVHRSKRANTFHGKSSPQKPIFEKTLSYVERETLRRETIAKKKEQEVVKKADQLLRTSMLDSQSSPTSYLPVLKNRNSPSIHIPSPSSSPHRENDVSPMHSTPNAAYLTQENETSVVLHSLEQPSQVSFATTNHQRKNNAQIESPKNPRQPAWCDNVKIEDKEFIKGRGKGRPREPAELVVADNPKVKHQAKSTNEKQGSKQKKHASNREKPEMNADSDVESIASHVISPRDLTELPLLLLDLHEASEMSDAEKLSAKAIAKARGKHRSKENAKKPLTNLEKNLLKSPLALPVMKAPLNPTPGMPTMSPRERALRSNVSPRVQSFIYPQKTTHKPVIVLVGGANGAKTGLDDNLSVVDKVSEMMKAEESTAKEGVQHEILTGHDESAEHSGQEAHHDEVQESSYYEAPLDSPALNLHSADISAANSVAHRSATELVIPSHGSSVDGTTTSFATTASNNTNTNTHLTNNSSTTTTPTVPRRSTVSPKPSPRVSPRNTVHRSGNAKAIHALPTRTTHDAVDAQVIPVEVSPRSRKEQLSVAARLSLSPQRSPRNTVFVDSDPSGNKITQNKVAKRNTVTSTLVSQSAPSSVVGHKTTNIDATVVEKLNLNPHIDDDTFVTSQAVVSSSPSKYSEEEKMKKKNTLKSLNERSNPNSPRDKFNPNSNSTDLGGIVSSLAYDVDVSSATVGPSSPS